MRSFNLFAIAAAALAPFAFAAPAPAPVPAPVEARDVAVRGETQGVPAILTGLQVNLQVNIVELSASSILLSKQPRICLRFIFNSDCLTSANATVEVITPILTDIVTIIGEAVIDLKALVGADISVILCSVDGTVTVAVSVVAQLLADILIALFGALGFVLTVVADVSILVDAIVSCALGSCLCGLISIILQLVDGLLACLIPLVLSLVDVILTLGLNVVGDVLQIL